MKVLVVIPAMSPEAGAEQSLFAVTPYLLAAGVHLEYVVFTEHQDLVPQLRDLGVPVHDLSGRTPLHQVVALRRLVSRLRPDVVHATLLQAALRAQAAALGPSRPPTLVTWANTPNLEPVSGVRRAKVGAYQLAEVAMGAVSRSRFHAVTEGVAITKSREVHVPRRRVRVAERGRDPKRFVADRPEVRARLRAEFGAGDDVVVLAVGRQEPQKGYPDLLRAFDETASRVRGCRLWIAGREGTASDEVRATLEGLHHRDRVTVLGHRQDVDDLLHAADVVACASLREGAAGALIEAMAAGTPIVSVELDGMVGVFEPERNAVVVPRGELAAGLARVVTDPELRRRLGEAGRSTFLTRFTTERSAAALVDVYRWASEAHR